MGISFFFVISLTVQKDHVIKYISYLYNNFLYISHLM